MNLTIAIQICKILFYINNFKFKIRELPSKQFVLITCCKTRINATQIKVDREIYIILIIMYNGEEGIREEN